MRINKKIIAILGFLVFVSLANAQGLLGDRFLGLRLFSSQPNFVFDDKSDLNKKLEAIERFKKLLEAPPIRVPVLTPTPVTPPANVDPRIVGRYKSGPWNVIETANSRIFYGGSISKSKAEEISKIIEQTRLDQLQKIGLPTTDWSKKVDIFIYDLNEVYTKMTGQGAASPGHSQTAIDKGLVVSRRIDLRGNYDQVVRAVFPHELSHIVVADKFLKNPCPRCFDEGLAVLFEPADRRDVHYKNLKDQINGGTRLYSAKQIVEMKDYPPGPQWPLFYAESTALSEFLSQKTSIENLTDFILAVQRTGYDQAVQKYYQTSPQELQRQFDQWVQKNIVGR